MRQISAVVISQSNPSVSVTGGSSTYVTTSNGAGISVTATSGDTISVTVSGTPTLTPATAGSLGGVRIGSGISVTPEGVISASSSYTLPAATSSALGGVIIGSGLVNSSGTISATAASVGAAASSHSHAISDVTGLQTALDGKQPSGTYATLVGGTVPSSQLPSYVDDVLEFAATANFPATGESGKIYVATGTGKVYRWSGSAYVEIIGSPGSTDAVPEGSVNLYYTAARAAAAAPVQSVAGRTGAVTIAAADVSGLGAAVDAKLSTQSAYVSFAGITMYDGPGSGSGMEIRYQQITGIHSLLFLSGGTQTTAWTGSAGDITSGTLSASRLPSSGVTAGTYTSVTVDATGRVTGGSNPSSGGKPLGLILALT
jgi:hypothetical protein